MSGPADHQGSSAGILWSWSVAWLQTWSPELHTQNTEKEFFVECDNSVTVTHGFDNISALYFHATPFINDFMSPVTKRF